ncbi:MAG: nitrilase-related carbon-nitrogen hydrolase, partial [Aquiluna sp.]
MSYAKAHNSATAFSGGNVLARYDKRRLPNYDVFDDWRNFVPGTNDGTFSFKNRSIGMAICEDIWGDTERADELSAAGVDLLV